jgi:hypothetical protein
MTPDSVTGEGLQATRLGYERREVLMSSDIDARISRLMDQMENPQLRPDQVQSLQMQIDMLRAQA